MKASLSTTVQVNRFNLPSTSNDEDDSEVVNASSLSDSDFEDSETSNDEKTSAPAVAKKNADIEANVKPSCPSSVSHIVNALSAVGTLGGLALIITGGMGMTLNKPVDNAMENVAMVLSGGALLVGSWIGNVAYARHQPA
jgi:septal ring-binding cell division protein DamX